MAKWEEFTKCLNCGYDIETGEGERSCNYGECAYLPEELNVFCDQCRFNWFTMEGDKKCEDDLPCKHSAVPRANAENLRRWKELHEAPAAPVAPVGSNADLA